MPAPRPAGQKHHQLFLVLAAHESCAIRHSNVGTRASCAQGVAGDHVSQGAASTELQLDIRRDEVERLSLPFFRHDGGVEGVGDAARDTQHDEQLEHEADDRPFAFVAFAGTFVVLAGRLAAPSAGMWWCRARCSPRSPPISSEARLASTSFMFMLLWVPDPVCQTASGNSSGWLPVEHFVGGADDGVGLVGWQLAQRAVDGGRGALDLGQRGDQFRRHALGRDVEMVQRTLGLRAPQAVGRRRRSGRSCLFQSCFPWACPVCGAGIKEFIAMSVNDAWASIFGVRLWLCRLPLLLICTPVAAGSAGRPRPPSSVSRA